MRGRRGFTLLELLVVIMIIGLLVGIVGPRLFGNVSKSEITAARAQMDALAKALEQYRLDTGRYPTTQDGLAALTHAPTGNSRWRGPYLRKAAPADPWGTPYQYTFPSPTTADEFQLLSLGADRATGGSGDGADIVH